MSCPTPDELFAGFEEGRDDPEWATHVHGCTRCQQYQEDFSLLTHAIAPQPDETFDAPDLRGRIVEEIRSRTETIGHLNGTQGEFDDPKLRAVIVADATKTPRLFGIRQILQFALAAAAVVAAVVIGTTVVDRNDGFTARGPKSEAEDRWVSVQAYELTDTEDSVPVGATIRPDARLMFAVGNRPPSAFRYLMILGVDEPGNVFWFYPEWTDPATNPTSIAVDARSEMLELGEAIRHQLSAGPLRIYALFSRRPLDVRAMESIVERARVGGIDTLDRLPVDDSGQQSILLQVER